MLLEIEQKNLFSATPSPINSYVPTPSPGQNYQPTPSPGYGAPSPLNFSPMTPGQPSPYTPQTPGQNIDALGQAVRFQRKILDSLDNVVSFHFFDRIGILLIWRLLYVTLMKIPDSVVKLESFEVLLQVNDIFPKTMT